MRPLLGLALLLAALPGAALPGVEPEPAAEALVALAVSASSAVASAGASAGASGSSVLLDYRAFLNSSLGARRLGGEAPAGAAAARALSVQWLAPFFSGGGYCSEAIAFAVGTQPDDEPAAAAGGATGGAAGRAAARDAEEGAEEEAAAAADEDGGAFLGIEFPLSIMQHGDGMNTPFLFGLEPRTYATLQRLAGREPRDRRRVLSVCHSEPGAWSVSRALPARYSTSACPAPGAAYRVGRTMFETDRLPQGWAERLNGMHEVWVPSRFMRDVCVAGGVDADKILVLPEPVDTDVFRPHAVPTALPAPPGGAGAARGGGGGGGSGGGALLPAPAAPPSTHIRPRRCVAADGATPVEPGATAECPFRFLSVGKWERRKGFDVLLRAYLTAFARNTTAGAAGSEAAAAAPAAAAAAAAPATAPGPPFVELYVLTSAYHSSGDFRQAVERMVRSDIACGSAANERAPPAARAVCVPPALAAAGAGAGGAGGAGSAGPAGAGAGALPPVHLLTAVPQSGLADVYASVDCAVQPSRGEGWGRPHVEAMASALPLVATAWGGPSEFMTEANSFPLRHGAELLPVPDGAFAGHLMAEPDAAHLRELLLRVQRAPAEARARGRRARADMRRLYHPRRLARFLNAHFARIEALVLRREEAEARARAEAEAERAARAARAGQAATDARARAEAEARGAEARLQEARRAAAARVASALAELEAVEREEMRQLQQRAGAAGAGAGAAPAEDAAALATAAAAAAAAVSASASALASASSAAVAAATASPAASASASASASADAAGASAVASAAGAAAASASTLAPTPAPAPAQTPAPTPAQTPAPTPAPTPEPTSEPTPELVEPSPEPPTSTQAPTQAPTQVPTPTPEPTLSIAATPLAAATAPPEAALEEAAPAADAERSREELELDALAVARRAAQAAAAAAQAAAAAAAARVAGAPAADTAAGASRVVRSS